MLRLSVSILWGENVYWKHVDADIMSTTAVNNFVRGLFREGVFLPLDEIKIDSGHFIYKLLCKWRQEIKPFPNRVVVEGVREAAPKLTEKEKQIQHALGLLNEHDIVIHCYNLDDYDMM